MCLVLLCPWLLLRFTSMHCHLQLTNAIHTRLCKYMYLCILYLCEYPPPPKCQFPKPPVLPQSFCASSQPPPHPPSLSPARNFCVCFTRNKRVAIDFHSPLGKQFQQRLCDMTHSNTFFVQFRFWIVWARACECEFAFVWGSFMCIKLKEYLIWAYLGFYVCCIHTHTYRICIYVRFSGEWPSKANWHWANA